MTLVTLLGLGLLVTGCEGSQSAPAAGTSAAPAATAAELSDSDLPIQADFDDEAEKQINAGNYKAEIDAIEKDMASP